MQRKTKDTTLGAQESRPGVDLSPLPPIPMLSAIKIFEKRTLLQNYPYFTCSQRVSRNYVDFYAPKHLQSRIQKYSRSTIAISITVVSHQNLGKKYIHIRLPTYLHTESSVFYLFPTSILPLSTKHLELPLSRNYVEFVYAISKNTCRQDTCSQESRHEVHLTLSPVSLLSAAKIFEKSTFISDQQMYLHTEYSYFTYLQPTSILPLSRKHVVLTLSRKVQICSQSVNYHYLGNAYISQGISDLPLSRNYVDLQYRLSAPFIVIMTQEATCCKFFLPWGLFHRGMHGVWVGGADIPRGDNGFYQGLFQSITSVPQH